MYVYIRLVENWNNWNKRAKPQVNTEKSCSNSKNGVGTRFSESRKDAGKHGKILFQLFWNKLEQTPQSLAYVLFPCRCVLSAGRRFFETISAHK